MACSRRRECALGECATVAGSAETHAETHAVPEAVTDPVTDPVTGMESDSDGKTVR